MSYRGRPLTIDQRVAELEARLRSTTTQVVGTVVITDHGGLDGLGDDDHGQYQLRDEQGVAGGYPDLDGTGVVPKAQLPADVVYAAALTPAEDATRLAWLAMAMGA